MARDRCRIEPSNASRLMGHSSSNVTETVYRHQIRPVITVGAEAMDKIFANEH